MLTLIMKFVKSYGHLKNCRHRFLSRKFFSAIQLSIILNPYREFMLKTDLGINSINSLDGSSGEKFGIETSSFELQIRPINWLKTIFPGWILIHSSDPEHLHLLGLQVINCAGFLTGKLISPNKAFSHSQTSGCSELLSQISVNFDKIFDAIRSNASEILFLIL